MTNLTQLFELSSDQVMVAQDFIDRHLKTCPLKRKSMPYRFTVAFTLDEDVPGVSISCLCGSKCLLTDT
jgi:hypothetical protein